MTHPLVASLVDLVAAKEAVGQPTPREALDQFWESVAEIGTPLLHQTTGGKTVATFLFREVVDHLITDRAYVSVTAAWRHAYLRDATMRLNGLALERLARTDVWWAETELPENFTGMYTYFPADRDGTIDEDIHEPWPMSFGDMYNERHTHDVDESYPSNIVTTKSTVSARPGDSMEIVVPAALLPLPKRETHRRGGVVVEPHPDTYPVWVHVPHPDFRSGVGVPLPLVALMAGQFLESADLGAQLDQAMESGEMPPAIVVAPGETLRGHTAWGWRNGYGPGGLSEFFSEALLPALGKELRVGPAVHLVAWDYTTFSAFETARRLPELVRSISVFEPWLYGPGKYPGTHWSVHEAASELAVQSPGFTVALASPPDRGGGRLAWRYGSGEEFASAIAGTGVHLVNFEVSDPNIVAAGEALGSAIGAVLSR